MAFKIKETREFYGPRRQAAWLTDHEGIPLRFEIAQEARAEIERLDREVYHLAHNESARPSYQIVKGAAQ